MLQKIDDLFTGEPRESYLKIARQAIEEAVSFYCAEVIVANYYYDDDLSAVVASYRKDGLYEEYTDRDSSVCEITDIVTSGVKDKVRKILANLSKDLIDDSFVDNLEVDVSRSKCFEDDYLSDMPDLYQEYRDQKADSRELEHIFER